MEVRHSGGYRLLVETDPGAGRVTAVHVLTPEQDDVDWQGTVAESDVAPGTLVARYGYDQHGHLSEVTNSSGTPLKLTHDVEGRLVGWVDRNDTAYHYVYDEAGRCVAQAGTGNALAYTYEYVDEAGGHVTIATDSLGAVRRYRMNSAFQVVAETDPLGHTTRRTWDTYDRLLAVTDPLGRVTRFERDDLGNPTTMTRPDGSQQRWEYLPGTSLPTVVQLPDGGRWEQGYDELGNVTVLLDPSGAQTRYGYDEAGHLRSITSPDGGTTAIETDGRGLPVVVVDADGVEMRYGRDAFGRVVEVVDGLGDRSAYTWTPEGWLASATDPAGGTETWSYDGEGNVVEYVDAAGAVTTTGYGVFDKPTTVVAPDGSVTELAYDTELRLVGVTNPAGQHWAYEYDPAGQLVAEVDFNGRELEYEYDAAGQVVRRTNGAGEVSELAYDVLGRLVASSSGEGASRFEHDPMGRLVRARNTDADVVLERDALGRVVAESINGRRLVHALDRTGLRIGRRTPNGVESVWQRTAAGRLAALEVGGHRLSFERDAVGRERVGAWGSSTLEQVWDQAGRITAQVLSVARPQQGPTPGAGVRDAVGGVDVLRSRAYGYRADGVLASVDDSAEGLTSFDLDPLGRVTTVRRPATAGADIVERYAYDAAGNLATAERTSFSGTLLTRSGDTEFSYDRQGRMVQRVRRRVSRKPEVWQYTWDAEDRLTGLVTPDGSRWLYRYDALGRRVAKDRLSEAGRIVERTLFCWDGATVVEQTSAEQSLTWEYDGMRPLAQVATSRPDDAGAVDAEFFAIVTDLVGAPSEVVSADGELVWASTRNLWGAGETGPVPLGFPGQYLDAESGLAYNVFRYYDPGTARYISADPLGLRGGPNPAAYVDNPTALVDPLGLSPCVPDSPGAGKPDGSRLADASAAALRASDDPSSIFIKDKHLASSSIRGGKFASDDIAEVRGWVAQGLRSDGVQFLPNQLDDTFRAIVPADGVVGTAGQTNIRVIVTNDGRVINAFPVHVR